VKSIGGNGLIIPTRKMNIGTIFSGTDHEQWQLWSKTNAKGTKTPGDDSEAAYLSGTGFSRRLELGRQTWWPLLQGPKGSSLRD
jgi:hypothetical protein